MTNKTFVYEIPLTERRLYRKLYFTPRQDARPLEEKVFQRIRGYFERDGLDVSQLAACRIRSHEDFNRAIKTGYPLSDKKRKELLSWFDNKGEKEEYKQPVYDLDDAGKRLKWICQDLLWNDILGYAFYHQEDRNKRTRIYAGFGDISVSVII
jgi:hypothetical protein